MPDCAFTFSYSPKPAIAFTFKRSRDCSLAMRSWIDAQGRNQERWNRSVTNWPESCVLRAKEMNFSNALFPRQLPWNAFQSTKKAKNNQKFLTKS